MGSAARCSSLEAACRLQPSPPPPVLPASPWAPRPPLPSLTCGLENHRGQAPTQQRPRHPLQSVGRPSLCSRARGCTRTWGACHLAPKPTLRAVLGPIPSSAVLPQGDDGPDVRGGSGDILLVHATETDRKGTAAPAESSPTVGAGGSPPSCPDTLGPGALHSSTEWVGAAVPVLLAHCRGRRWGTGGPHSKPAPGHPGCLSKWVHCVQVVGPQPRRGASFRGRAQHLRALQGQCPS